MEATKLLKQDHSEVKGLFKEYESAGNGAHKTKEDIFEKIRANLDIHSTIEEEIFYPAVEEAIPAKEREIIREAIEEHKLVNDLLDELSAMQVTDEQFDAKITVLKENVEHHADEEEDEMFSQAKKHLSKDRLEELGAEMDARKEEIKHKIS